MGKKIKMLIFFLPDLHNNPSTFFKSLGLWSNVIYCKVNMQKEIDTEIEKSVCYLLRRFRDSSKELEGKQMAFFMTYLETILKALDNTHIT